MKAKNIYIYIYIYIYVYNLIKPNSHSLAYCY
jgi:hypothetical protein